MSRGVAQLCVLCLMCFINEEMCSYLLWTYHYTILMCNCNDVRNGSSTRCMLLLLTQTTQLSSKPQSGVTIPAQVPRATCYNAAEESLGSAATKAGHMPLTILVFKTN